MYFSLRVSPVCKSLSVATITARTLDSFKSFFGYTLARTCYNIHGELIAVCRHRSVFVWVERLPAKTFTSNMPLFKGGNCTFDFRICQACGWLRQLNTAMKPLSNKRRRWTQETTFLEWPCWLSKVSIKVRILKTIDHEPKLDDDFLRTILLLILKHCYGNPCFGKNYTKTIPMHVSEFSSQRNVYINEHPSTNGHQVLKFIIINLVET